jgi:hypothetical protein
MIIIASIADGSFFKPLKEQSFAEQSARVGLTSFLSSLVIWLTASFVLEENVQGELQQIATVYSSQRDQVYVNDTLLPEPLPLIRELSRFKYITPHNSSPGESATVRIILNGKETKVILRRDSQRKDEYWVYYPLYESTRNEEVGRLRTPYFTLFNFN